MNNATDSTRQEKFYKRLIYIVSVAIFLVILALSQKSKAGNIPSWARVLPAINAILNGTTFLVLLLSFYHIRKKNIAIHRRLNLLACSLSVLFLMSYVTFHSFGVETKFPADNPLRPVYLIILLSHIVLAAVVMPLVLLSLYRGLTMQVERHRKITRWSYPIWLYVTLSGVIVYLMISPHYQF